MIDFFETLENVRAEFALLFFRWGTGPEEIPIRSELTVTQKVLQQSVALPVQHRHILNLVVEFGCQVHTH